MRYVFTDDPVTEPGQVHVAGDSVFLDVVDADGINRAAQLRAMLPGDVLRVGTDVPAGSELVEYLFQLEESQLPDDDPDDPDATTAILTGTITGPGPAPTPGTPMSVTITYQPRTPGGPRNMPTEVFKMPDGELGFSTTEPVNAGDVTLSTIAEYQDYSCRITSATITSTPNFDTETVPGTMCDPPSETNTPQATSFRLQVDVLQDPQDDTAAGLAKFLWDNDSGVTGVPVWFYVGLVKGAAPKAIGQCMIYPMDFGGTPRQVLVASLDFPCEGRPSPEWGTTADV